MSRTVHATAVAFPSTAGRRALLILGPSGAGKSDLALRLIAAGGRLVADDRCDVWPSGDGLYVAAQAGLPHRIEARGVGLLPALLTPSARLALAIEGGGEGERLPDPAAAWTCGDRSVPLLRLDLRHASTPAKIACAMRTLGAGVGLA